MPTCAIACGVSSILPGRHAPSATPFSNEHRGSPGKRSPQSNCLHGFHSGLHRTCFCRDGKST